uniref:Flagellin n=1 Tax=viral metagenome TaxID=1070528 RepID=A0A6H1Z7Q0_9ZZZZ
MNGIIRKLHRGQRGMTGLETAIILIAFVTVASVLAYSVLSAGIFSAERGKATVYSGLESAQATMEVEGSVLGLATDGAAATLTTGTEALDEIDYVADTTGIAGNSITIAYIDPETVDQLLTVTVTGTDIVVSLATDGVPDIISTADEVVAAINAHPAASALVDATSIETGVMVAMGETNLAGGIDMSLTDVQFNVGLTIQGGDKVDMSAVVVNYFDKDIHEENVEWIGAISGGSHERGAAALLEEDEIFVVSVTIPDAASLGAYDNFTLQVIPPTGATITLQRTLPGGISAVMDLQ